MNRLSTVLASSFASILGSSLAVTAQIQVPGADLVIPDREAEVIQRMIDRDNDGRYAIAGGEAYDLVTPGQNVAFRTVVFLNGWLYTCGVTTEAVWKGRDVNADGIIDFNTEFTKAFDWAANFDPNPSLLDLTTDGTSLWVTNNRGTNEGIFRMEDTNGDGDFALSEVHIALGETLMSTVALGNVPGNTSPPGGTGRTLTLTNFQSISYDPDPRYGFGGKGRLLVEHETNEGIIALEDTNGDGDFDDAGEVYLFLLLSANTNTGLVNDNFEDVSPARATLGPAYDIDFYEIEHVAVDLTNPTQPVYYITSEETGDITQQAVLFRGVDSNNDGDINDLGELTVHFDGSTDSALGSAPEYQAIDGIGLGLNGSDIYLTVERRRGGINDADQVIVLDDANGNGVIDQRSEVQVVFSKTEAKMANVLVLPQGTLTPPPAGVVGYYTYLDRSSCAPSQSTVANPVTHRLTVGTSLFDDKLVVGNSVTLRTTDAPTGGAPSVIHFGVPLTPAFPLSTDGSCAATVAPFFTLPSPIGSGTIGTWDFVVPINGGLIGIGLTLQSLSLDFALNPATNPIFVTSSNAVFVQFGTYAFTQSSLN